jgi:hypothetical protein
VAELRHRAERAEQAQAEKDKAGSERPIMTTSTEYVTIP